MTVELRKASAIYFCIENDAQIEEFEVYLNGDTTTPIIMHPIDEND